MRRRLGRCPTSANNIVDPAASNRATDVIDRQQTDDDDHIRGKQAKRPREDCNVVPFHGQSLTPCCTCETCETDSGQRQHSRSAD